MFKLGSGSASHLSEGKPQIQRVVRRGIMITAVDFSVVDCRRTEEEQRENIANGVSWTMDSRHIADPADNRAFAVDIYPWHNGKTDHSIELYNKIAKAMFKAAIIEGVDIEWGGFWSTPDRPHWQLSRQQYKMLTNPKSD